MSTTIFIALVTAIFAVILRPIISPLAYADLEIFRQLSVIFCLLIVARRDLDTDIERSYGWWVDEFRVRTGLLMLVFCVVAIFIDFSTVAIGALLSAILCSAIYLEFDPSKRAYVWARSFKKLEEFVLLILAFTFSSILPMPYGLFCALLLIFWLVRTGRIVGSASFFLPNFGSALAPLVRLRFITVLLNTTLELCLFLIMLRLFESEFLIYDIYLKVVIFPLIAIQSYLTPRLALGASKIEGKSLIASLISGISGVVVFHLVFSYFAIPLSDYKPIPFAIKFLAISVMWLGYQWFSLKFFERFSQNGRVLILATANKAFVCGLLYLLGSHFTVGSALMLIPGLHLAWFVILLGISDDSYTRFRLG